MRLLYYETSAYAPSSAHFLEALHSLSEERSDFKFEFLDEARLMNLPRSIAGRALMRLRGGRPPTYWALNRALLESTRRFSPEVVVIGKGRYFAPRTLSAVKGESGAVMINWASDDPFNRSNSSANLLASIPLYDLYVSPRRAALAQLEELGAGRTAYVRFGYKPEVHYPESPANPAESARFACDVAFIGGADTDRAPYFDYLVSHMPELRLHLYGGQWHRFPRLRDYWRGEATGRDYRLAVTGAAINLNLVRRANRDDHVMRTFELPACGGFMLAERTETHCALFAEGTEAAFFTTPEEMTQRIAHYLPRAGERRQVAAAGHARVIAGGNSYRDRLAKILALAAPLTAERRKARGISEQAA